jgi:hypothetical protein
VELLSGPVLSELDAGCESPQQLAFVGVCSGPPGCKIQTGVQPWNDSPEFNDGYEAYPQRWSNIYSCATNTGNTAPWNSVWNNMSILSASITAQQLSYPSTSMNAWLCGSVYNNSEPMNNSSAQGWFFYSDSRVSFRTGWQVNAVTNCDGPEAVMGPDAVSVNSQGVVTPAFNLITQDMVNSCKPHH